MSKPATKDRVEKYIMYAEYIFNLTPGCKKLWEHIKIEPEKWEEKEMGEQGGGFWAIAILGKEVLYYNDVEDGFNFSSYKEYGKIDHYYPGQSELHDVILSMYNEIILAK
jgi:hypothetical protein